MAYKYTRKQWAEKHGYPNKGLMDLFKKQPKDTKSSEEKCCDRDDYSICTYCPRLSLEPSLPTTEAKECECLLIILNEDGSTVSKVNLQQD